ncbi:HAD hydrolase-like protein [Actinosynnema sp. NPDC020468]|uniref:HAD family hydrolase n=1 Tax=Actinosynnema sp. NPDC020468 TaxID=3154488 RepID=UPI0033EBFAA3
MSRTLVLLDWNGTVMSDTERARDATNAVLRGRGLPDLTTDQFRHAFRLPMTAFLTGLGVHDVDRAEHEWNTHLAGTPARPRPEAKAVLAELVAGGATVGVISAAATHAVRADARAAGLEPLLTVVDGGVADKLGRLREHRGDYGRAVYVGDTEYDVRCARSADYRPVAITGGYRPADALRAAGPDHLVDTLAALPGILAEPARVRIAGW